MSITVPIIDTVMKQFGKLIPDKTLRDQFKANLELAETEGEFNLAIAQTEVNKVEAAHKDWRVAGWRPFVGWIGGLGFGYTMFSGPITALVFYLTGYTMEPLGPMHYTVLMTILGGMLGLRSLDKKNGVSTEHLVPQVLEDGTPIKKKGILKKLFRR